MYCTGGGKLGENIKYVMHSADALPQVTLYMLNTDCKNGRFLSAHLPTHLPTEMFTQ